MGKYKDRKSPASREASAERKAKQEERSMKRINNSKDHHDNLSNTGSGKGDSLVVNKIFIKPSI